MTNQDTFKQETDLIKLFTVLLKRHCFEEDIPGSIRTLHKKQPGNVNGILKDRC